MSKLYPLIILMAGMSGKTFAQPPECPIFKNKQECMHSVESNYKKYLDFIDNSTDEEDPAERERMLQASVDIKKYESLACHKTCLD